MFGRRNQADIADDAEVDAIVLAWDRACRGSGLTRRIESVVGSSELVPAIVHIVLGTPTILTVRLEPGMTCQDVRDLAPRLAPHLGAYGLRVVPRGTGEWAVVTLLTKDPLSDTYSLPADSWESDARILIGRDEDGQDVTVDVYALGHAAVQGATRSGKSAWMYSILAQLTDRQKAGFPLTIGGIDPSGILLRPFAATSILGLRNAQAVEDYLTNEVAEMDRRIADMPIDRDVLDITPDNPLRFVIMEELPGLWRWLDSIDAKQGKRCRASLARLLAEGHKAGIRVFLIAQRAEAGVIGATERAQCTVRISFRVDTVDSLKMLHPDADPATAETHSREVPGVAQYSTPGRPLTRIRGPWVGSYADFVKRVSQ